MGRAAAETNVAECAVEPDHNTQRRHGATALGADEQSDADRKVAIRDEGMPKIGVKRDQPAAAVLGGVVARDVGCSWQKPEGR
jgi:hypothetical protein